ncbi:N4-gp56 family major capsid protein [Ottowia sp. VDI28]|uniref:N4-gp56 family major capsid protein n=1 Tax=Ottowia sp. VDI28 TaxID=3133968 RepID=UPI003C30C786
MDTKTNVPHGAEGAMIQQAVGVFGVCTQRNTQMRHLTGSMPKIDAAVAAAKGNQSKTSMPIVRADNLTKNKGDEITFNLDNPIGGYPIMGSEYAEGRGIGMSFTGDKLRVNQARFPVDMGNTMTQIRSPYDMRRMARPKAQKLMNQYMDQSILVHLSGARGYHDHKIEWSVPVDTHPKFADILVNPVRAPSKNRHLVAGAGSVGEVQVNAGELTIATTDLLSMDVLDSVRAWGDSIPLPPPPVEFDGDQAATDSPLRVFLASPAQYSTFSTDPAFRAFQANAHARARLAKDHPLFLGDAGLWNGILILKNPKPIRFYAGDTIKYCADYTSEAESSCVVPASFGTQFAVDRGLLLGGQALAMAFGASEHSGIPFFWSEKDMDHSDKREILIGAILGMSKIRFNVDHGDHKEITDHGVTVLDTAVKIIKPRG